MRKSQEMAPGEASPSGVDALALGVDAHVNQEKHPEKVGK